MIMYFVINFIVDEFEELCVEGEDLCEKYTSYECVPSNYSNYSNLISTVDLLSDEKFVYNNYLNNCFNVLIVFFVTSTSLLFSILIVSICVYEKMINEFAEKYNANKEYYEYDTYFFEYLDEFNELNNIKIVDDYLNDTYLNSLEYKYIKQKTPKGDVLMYYNNTNSSFDYYCKKSNTIDFLYLDVVSRIYVVKYNCKNIYIDNYDNFELIKDYYNNLNNSSSSVDELKENTIFYNRVNTKNKTKQPIEYVSNKYKYRGTFDDFNNYCKINNFKIHTQDLLENDIFVLQKNIETDDEVDAEVDHEVDAEVDDEVDAELDDEVDAEVDDEVDAEVTNDVTNDEVTNAEVTNAELDAEVTNEVTNEVTAQVTTGVNKLNDKHSNKGSISFKKFKNMIAVSSKN